MQGPAALHSSLKAIYTNDKAYAVQDNFLWPKELEEPEQATAGYCLL